MIYFTILIHCLVISHKIKNSEREMKTLDWKMLKLLSGINSSSSLNTVVCHKHPTNKSQMKLSAVKLVCALIAQ